MVALMIILTIVVFIIVDILSRTALRKYHEAQARKEREKALDIGLKLNYTDEAPSLKRVEVAEKRLRAAERALEAEQARYDAGSSTLVELQNARASYVDAASQIVRARYDVLFRQKLIDYYVGVLDPEQQLWK